MKILLMIFFSLSLSCALSGCGGFSSNHRTVTAPSTASPAPPAPPTLFQLQKPPAVMLEKPSRDPFVALNTGKGGGASGLGGGPLTGGGGISTSGVIVNGRPSAILEMGSNSHVVHPGETIEGYFVQSITLQGVTLMKGREKLVIPMPPGK